jgi:hypothetical protein
VTIRSNLGGRAALQAVPTLEAARRDVDCIFVSNRVLHDMQQPVVPLPTEPIIRTEAVRKNNRIGCVIESAKFVAAKASVACAAIGAAAKRPTTTTNFWARHREAVLAAEAALEEHRDHLSNVTKVGDLKALIISRTGRTVKAKADDRGALRAEAEAARRALDTTTMPVEEADAVPRAIAGGVAS